MHRILGKLTLVKLPIGENQLPSAFLGVALQLPLISHPLLIQFIEIGEVEAALKLDLLVVIYDAFAVELVLLPLSLIGNGAVGVEKHAKSVHFVVLPISVVVAAFFVVEFAFAVPHAIQLPPLIPGSYCILLDNILNFLLGIGSDVRGDLVRSIVSLSCFSL